MPKNTLPANLPDAPDASLPKTYEAAQQALSHCFRIDEAWTWQNKAAALAAYARMARDTALRDTALRIQARAIRRAGELLRMVPPASGERTDIEPRDGSDPRLTRELAAEDAGMSERQRKTALRVANMPEAEFTAAVENPKPPTIGELAMRGTMTRVVPDPAPEVPAADPGAVARAHRGLREFSAFCGTHDPVAVARGAGDVDMLRGQVETISAWLDRFVVNLPESQGDAA